MILAPLRIGLVVLLLGGAYFAIAPWVECAFPLGRFAPDLTFIRICTFGTGFRSPIPEPVQWPRLLFGAVYLVAALWVGRTRRIRFV